MKMIECKINRPGPVLTAVASGLSALLFTGSLAAANESGSHSTATARRPIPCAEAVPMHKPTIRLFPGTVRASQRVELAFSVSGLLTELNAQEGCRLNQGDLIARLDPADYQHAADMARATYADGKRAYERAAALKEDKVISEADYDRALAAVACAEADLRIKEKALTDTVLRAPFDGVISRRYVENHEHIQDKQPVVSFQNISRPEIVIQVPEGLAQRDFQNSLGGLQVRLKDENAKETAWMDAELSEFCMQSDPVTHTYEVVVRCNPAEGIRLLPGMAVTVKSSVMQRSADSAVSSPVWIPLSAVWGGNHGETFVWVIPPSGGEPLRRSVTTGRIDDEGIEIISGLNAGELVAVAGLHGLHEQVPVRPMAKNAEGLDG